MEPNRVQSAVSGTTALVWNPNSKVALLRILYILYPESSVDGTSPLMVISTPLPRTPKLSGYGVTLYNNICPRRSKLASFATGSDCVDTSRVVSIIPPRPLLHVPRMTFFGLSSAWIIGWNEPPRLMSPEPDGLTHLSGTADEDPLLASTIDFVTYVPPLKPPRLEMSKPSNIG